MAKENYSILQVKNLNKVIKIKLSNDNIISGTLKGFNPYEVHIERSNGVYTVNKGAIMYMVLA